MGAGMGTNLNETVADLVTANHILFDQGVVDAFGHVSVRHPDKPGCFLLSRAMAPSHVSAADIVEHDEHGEPIDANGRAVYLERFLHAEIYRSRSDVRSVVHSHSPAVIPFGISSVPLRPAFHMASFLDKVSRFDIHDRFGRETDLLIRDREKGRYLAQALGGASVTLMRGHGSVAVGCDIREAVYRAIYTEVNARIQTQAVVLGGVLEYLTSEEATAATQANASQTGRCWALWSDEARVKRAR
jgi:ribulose-5-phosphate 4-epimerase/fuculose-1-phosphate aldolase